MLSVRKGLWQIIFVVSIITICILLVVLFTKPHLSRLSSVFNLEWSDQYVCSSKSNFYGILFKGNIVREFPRHLSRYMNLTQTDLEQITNPRKSVFSEYRKPKECNNWVVVTTIFSPSESVKKAAELDGWCLVVVADKKSSLSYDLDNVVYLSVQEQQKLSNHFKFIRQLPWNHFGRKNIGYFYAMLHEAEYIFDLDDDNVLHRT